MYSKDELLVKLSLFCSQRLRLSKGSSSLPEYEEYEGPSTLRPVSVKFIPLLKWKLGLSGGKKSEKNWHVHVDQHHALTPLV